jgi:hypothetical protein
MMMVMMMVMMVMMMVMMMGSPYQQTCTPHTTPTYPPTT